MDPVTHALLGACTGFSLFGKRLGKKAGAIGALSAFVPDADVFIRSSTDPLLALEYHRHFTHSLAFAPIGAAIVASLWLFQKTSRAHFGWLWLCAVTAYLTHCLLDSATTYGTQLLWPFSNMRVGWDWISIVDPIPTAFLIAGVILVFRRNSFRPATLALIFFVAYIGWGIIQHARATKAQALIAFGRGHKIERWEVMPTIGNNIVWRSIYESNGRLYTDRIRAGWLSKPTVREGESLPLATIDDLGPAEKAVNQRARAFERFSWFSSGWVARSPNDPAIIGDMRYSLSPAKFDPIWGIRYTPEKEIGYKWVNRSRNRKIAVHELWNEIIGRSEFELKK